MTRIRRQRRIFAPSLLWRVSVRTGGLALAAPSITTDYSARIRLAAEQLWWNSLDLLLPPHCAGCGRVGERLCGQCQSEIEYISGNICERCGYPHANTPTLGECDQCGRIPFLGQGLRSVAFHSGPLRRALHTLKYRQNVPLCEALARLMASRWPGVFPANAVLMPVPLSLERMQERGFNQAELLARQLAGQRGLPLVTNALKRVRHTPSQVGLNRAQRLVNVNGAFSAAPILVRNQTIILIDDVCTTGATLGACARVLVESGAAGVWAYTLARAPRADADQLH